MLASRGEADSSVLDSIFLNADYDFDALCAKPTIETRYQEIIKSGKQPLIIDCGANIGASSAFFRMRYPDALGRGLELALENTKLATDNTEKLINVTVLNQAIGPKSGSVGYTNPELGTYDAFRVDENNMAGNQIPAVTMEEVFANNDGAVPFIAKVDIEGF